MSEKLPLKAQIELLAKTVARRYAEIGDSELPIHLQDQVRHAITQGMVVIYNDAATEIRDIIDTLMYSNKWTPEDFSKALIELETDFRGRATAIQEKE